MLLENDRRTKIVWSFESDCLNADLAELVTSEKFDCLRLVYKSGEGPEIVSFLKQLRNQDNNRVPVMLDVTLPARGQVANLRDPLDVSYGDTINIGPKGSGYDIEVATDCWDDFFLADNTIYVGYGNVVFTVLKVSSEVVEVEVVQGGVVYDQMDIHVPATRRAPVPADFDKQELAKILAEGVDFVVVPGFTDPADIGKMRQICEESGSGDCWIFLKANSDKVYEQLDSLLEHVHGVVISRLDLALFMEPAMVPVITKEIIQLCDDRAKVVCTASEMLGSMRQNATPTRAEVSDVANAVVDGSDAVFLTEEIPYGKHGQRAIRLMRKIVEDVEQSRTVLPNWSKDEPTIREEMDAVAHGAYKTAQRVGAKAIVCLTREGNTALTLASSRTQKPIIAVTFSKPVLRRLSLVRGVDGVMLDSDPLIDDVLPVVNDILVRDSWLQPDDKYVFVSVTLSSLGRQESNLFTVQTLS